MVIKLLKPGYKNNEEFYQAFLSGDLLNHNEYFSDEVLNIEEVPDFPIYMGKGTQKKKREDFLEAFETISEFYLDTDRDIHLDELFWHSLLTGYKRDYIIDKYPQVKNGIKDFNNIVIKQFDWENYIYKCVLGAQYINDYVDDRNERERYYNLIIGNLDIYNYMIKSEVFRNDKFLLNILDIIEEHNLSEILKGRVKGRDDLGKDERVGRRVIFEFDKAYPVILSPMMEKEELEELFFEYLKLYYKDIELKEEIEEIKPKRKLFKIFG